jgi:hypothetical protein
MKISGDTKKIALVLAQFIEDIDFHVEGTVLSVKKAGFREGVMQTTLGEGTIRRYHNLPYFGITSWAYTDGAGTKIAPVQAPPNFAHHELIKMFESSKGFSLTEEESKIVRDSVIQAAAESPVVRAWAEKLDFEALHAFDHVSEPGGREKAYEWIAGDEAVKQGMKKFVRDFPMLALAVFYGGDTYEAATAGKTPEESYKIAVDHVIANGLPCDAGVLDGIWSVGPMSMEFLDSMRGLKVDVSGMGLDQSVITVVEAIDLARRLPVGSLPLDRAGFLSLCDCGTVLRELQSDDGSVTSGFGRGEGFAMVFTDAEVAQMFAGAAAVKFANLPKKLEGSISMQSLGCYGVLLAGHEDWIRKHIQDHFKNVHATPPGMTDFSALKSALVSEGFVAVQNNAVAFFKEALANTEMDQAPSP